MDIIVKYEIECGDDYINEIAAIDSEDLKEQIMGQIPNRIRIQLDGDYLLTEPEPTVFIAVKSTVITTNLNGKESICADTSHVDTFKGLSEMFKK